MRGGSFSKAFGQFEERKKEGSVLGVCYLSEVNLRLNDRSVLLVPTIIDLFYLSG